MCAISVLLFGTPFLLISGGIAGSETMWSPLKPGGRDHVNRACVGLPPAVAHAHVLQGQYFWEAFPASSGPTDRTTYMFTYLDASPHRQSLEEVCPISGPAPPTARADLFSVVPRRAGGLVGHPHAPIILEEVHCLLWPFPGRGVVSGPVLRIVCADSSPQYLRAPAEHTHARTRAHTKLLT